VARLKSKVATYHHTPKTAPLGLVFKEGMLAWIDRVEGSRCNGVVAALRPEVGRVGPVQLPPR